MRRNRREDLIIGGLAYADIRAGQLGPCCKCSGRRGQRDRRGNHSRVYDESKEDAFTDAAPHVG